LADDLSSYQVIACPDLKIAHGKGASLDRVMIMRAALRGGRTIVGHRRPDAVIFVSDRNRVSGQDLAREKTKERSKDKRLIDERSAQPKQTVARKTRGKSRRKRLTPRWLFVLGFGRKLNATGCPERRRTGHVAIRPNRCWATNVIIGGIGIMMMEPTLTQNSALYFVQHKVSRPRASLFQRFGAAARKQSPSVSQAQLRGNLFRWPRIHWGKNS